MKALVLVSSGYSDTEWVSGVYLADDDVDPNALAKEWRETTFKPRTWHNKHGSGLTKAVYPTISIFEWLRKEKGILWIEWEKMDLD